MATAGVGSTIDVLGTLNTVVEPEVLGEADADTVNLDPDSTSGSIKIDGQGGEDDVNVTLGATVAGKSSCCISTRLASASARNASNSTRSWAAC